MEEYYVYIYLDPRKEGNFAYGDMEFEYEPFYVGKGKNNRYLDHLKLRNIDKRYNPIKFGKIKHILDCGLKPIILKIKEGLSEEDALKEETTLISKIDVINNGGPLSNLTKGGDGGDTWIFLPEELKQERKKKLSKSLKGHKTFERTDAYKEIVRASVKEACSSEEWKKQHSLKTKKGMEEKGITSEEISKRTKEGMKNVPYEKLAFWKYHKRIKKEDTIKVILKEELENYLAEGWIVIGTKKHY